MSSRKIRAFTLIELLIVLLILSLVVFITAPNLARFVRPKESESFVVKLQNTLQYLNELAILKKRFYLFIFDIDDRSYYFRISEAGNPEGRVRERYLRKVKLPEYIEIKRVFSQQGGEVYEGRMIIPFTPRGFIYSFSIDFKAGSKVYRLIANSITSEIVLEEKSKGD